MKEQSNGEEEIKEIKESLDENEELTNSILKEIIKDDPRIEQILDLSSRFWIYEPPCQHDEGIRFGGNIFKSKDFPGLVLGTVVAKEKYVNCIHGAKMRDWLFTIHVPKPENNKQFANNKHMGMIVGYETKKHIKCDFSLIDDSPGHYDRFIEWLETKIYPILKLECDEK
jgi:hypothetical protein